MRTIEKRDSFIREGIDRSECRRRLSVQRLGPSDSARPVPNHDDELVLLIIEEEYQPGSGQFDDELGSVEVPVSFLAEFLDSR